LENNLSSLLLNSLKVKHHFKESVKVLFGSIVILLFLKVTGLASAVSFVTQSAALHAGLMNVSTDVATERFDYNFTIKDLAGNKISFEEYKGKVIFLNLWATWCGPCRAEMPTIQKLYDQANRNQISFVMLSIDKDANRDKVVQYISDKAFTFPAFMPSGYLPDQLNVSHIPTTLVISKQGKIVLKEVGMRNYDTRRFQKLLEKLANE
jgi:thiol-disulfide isomerase/thioredoxin